MERREKSLMLNIDKIVGKEHAETGYIQLLQDQEDYIRQTALAVLHDTIKSAVCKFEICTISIKSAGEKVKIKRTDTKTKELEA